MGRVFDEEKHAIIHKWLLLADPEDPTSNAKGYVKVCVAIIGPGDEPPVLYHLNAIVHTIQYMYLYSILYFTQSNSA